MLPEVQIYVDAIEAADATRIAQQEMVDRSRANHFDRTLHRQRTNCVSDQRELVSSLAWEELTNTATDPLLKLLLEDFSSYREQIEVLMRALPCTLEEMNRLRREHSWCEVYDRFIGRARLQNLLPGQMPLSAARQKLVSWFLGDDDNDRTINDESVTQLLELIDAVVTEHVTLLERVELLRDEIDDAVKDAEVDQILADDDA